MSFNKYGEFCLKNWQYEVLLAVASFSEKLIVMGPVMSA